MNGSVHVRLLIFDRLEIKCCVKTRLEQQFLFYLQAETQDMISRLVHLKVFKNKNNPAGILNETLQNDTVFLVFLVVLLTAATCF